MTDSEKLDLILTEISDLKSNVSNLKSGMQEVNNRLDKIESEVSALKTGQTDIRKDIKKVDKRVSDTYELALESWGTSTENRSWLENSKLTMQ